jgi:hypothetical protein
MKNAAIQQGMFDLRLETCDVLFDTAAYAATKSSHGFYASDFGDLTQNMGRLDAAR